MPFTQTLWFSLHRLVKLCSFFVTDLSTYLSTSIHDVAVHIITWIWQKRQINVSNYMYNVGMTSNIASATCNRAPPASSSECLVNRQLRQFHKRLQQRRKLWLHVRRYSACCWRACIKSHDVWVFPRTYLDSAAIMSSMTICDLLRCSCFMRLLL